MITVSISLSEALSVPGLLRVAPAKINGNIENKFQEDDINGYPSFSQI